MVQKKNHSLIIIFISSLIILFFSPTSKDYQFFNLWKHQTGQENLKTLRLMQGLELKDEVNLLENEGGFTWYLPDNYKWIRGYSKQEGFNEFIEENSINMIYVNSALLRDPRFSNDIEWKNFIYKPKTLNFVKYKIEEEKAYLLIDQSLLKDK